MMKKLILLITLASVTQATSSGDVNVKDLALCPGVTSCEIEGLYFPHPLDCQKFCQCVGGQAVEFSCPAGSESAIFQPMSLVVILEEVHDDSRPMIHHKKQTILPMRLGESRLK
ncbi:unnamed protein product [Cyprideis torosa]|uniref:Chitin-binding type-2 domain-containing protein n=1 Tax=Cyprideis torosa TaxID=163714 RepID=A0A7R8WDJ5_9CRUS|nr:unnamed protein product [Cyprideis torosa]CAG0893250.1 unnamed protein product [Cyprideis torosa]